MGGGGANSGSSGGTSRASAASGPSETERTFCRGEVCGATLDAGALGLLSASSTFVCNPATVGHEGTDRVASTPSVMMHCNPACKPDGFSNPAASQAGQHMICTYTVRCASAMTQLLQRSV